MTRVEIYYHSNIIYGFRMEGHAGYNPNGPDVVCASLSAASQLTTNGIIDWLGVDAEEIVKELNQKAGILHVEVPLEMFTNVTIHQLFKSFEMYIEQLSELYKDNVKLERRYDQ